MNFEEFFKLNKRKIISTTILFLLFLINYLLGIFVKAGNKTHLVIRNFLFWIIALPLQIINILFNNLEGIFVVIILLVIEVLYCYLLVCFIGSLFRKNQ